MKRGSALIMALWTIVVLSIMVMSFVYEADRQSGLNTYVQQRNRANHLIESGKILAEMILLDYKNVEDWSPHQSEAEMLKDDAWYKEKQELKTSSKCTIGPVMLDEEDPFGSLVTVTIETSNSSDNGVININELYQSTDGTTDRNVTERWWMIFRSHDIPEELVTKEEGRINLWNVLIASWKDWRDSDSTVSSVDGKECGAEDEWYEELEEKYKDLDEDQKNELKRRPRNGPIPDVRELDYVRGFRDYPAVLKGGVLNPWEDPSRQIRVKGIYNLFCTEGPMKINVNNCKSIDALVTIPGIFDKSHADDDDVLEEAREVAQAIIDGLSVEPDEQDIDRTRSSWPYKDWSDMLKRIDNLRGSNVRSEDIGSEAKEYLAFTAEEDSIFKVRIEAMAGTMARIVEGECYIKDKKVRYVKWNEAPPAGK